VGLGFCVLSCFMSSSFIRESESTSTYLSKHIVTGLVVGGGKKNHVIQVVNLPCTNQHSRCVALDCFSDRGVSYTVQWRNYLHCVAHAD
jgi:hypothetical protein